ncbi:hypothetical protein TGS27_2197 [Geobacillus stearothermophilus]|uniref:Uncharacterized protein n=1 Tax=Geobacillus stearothermophilus TaxID=1422 RepID=A0A150MAX1_GEOSE|nr:hypothetical protein B4109_2442 [Geobacillus stearothermophilus]OAO79443.1 hypothetical protein TGS27_2197 [Geobacillus stearothermophilus]
MSGFRLKGRRRGMKSVFLGRNVMERIPALNEGNRRRIMK